MIGRTNKLSLPQIIPYNYLKPRISKTIEAVEKVTL